MNEQFSTAEWVFVLSFVWISGAVFGVAIQQHIFGPVGQRIDRQRESQSRANKLRKIAKRQHGQSAGVDFHYPGNFMGEQGRQLFSKSKTSGLETRDFD